MFAEIDRSAALPFEWGVNDCCQFVARVVDAMTDSTLVDELREHYHDEATALAFLVDHEGLQFAVTSFLGEPVEARTTRGDAVLFEGGEGFSVGICTGPDIVGVGP